MATKTKITETVRITDIRRLKSSSLGNPTWWIEYEFDFGGLGTSSHGASTSANTSWAYAVGDHLIGKTIELEFTKRGRIVGAV